MFACALALAGCQLGAPTPTLETSKRSGSDIGRAAVPRVSLRENTQNAIAWAPLSDVDDVTVEGSVPSSRAWSTSKVLVVAAYLETVADGDPSNVPADVRGDIHAALARSDERSIIAIRHRIPNTASAMTRVLRVIGDTNTKVPPAYEGAMQWTVREQVRFMAALGNGRVVSPRASAFLLREMQPIESQRWGLGTVGARAFKGGWMDTHTESRQMGIVGDFAVAIITAGDVARKPRSGDNAHVTQLNRLAQLLATRIGEGRCFKSQFFSCQPELISAQFQYRALKELPRSRVSIR